MLGQGISSTDPTEHLIYISKRHLFPWIKGVLDWSEDRGGQEGFIGAGNLGSHRCGNCSIIILMTSSIATTISSLVNMASSAR